MADVHDIATRKRNMRAIRGRDTKPELIVRKLLWQRGFRYRLQGKKLPGRPDLVLKKYNAVIFVHGCFWHLHDCAMFKWPGTRQEFWREKLTGNRMRDQRNIAALRDQGWRVGQVWECALKGRGRLAPEQVSDPLTDWLHGPDPMFEIRGRFQS